MTAPINNSAPAPTAMGPAHDTREEPQVPDQHTDAEDSVASVAPSPSRGEQGATAVEQQGPYPEHEKLAKIQDQSQLIGEFLDVGLPQMGLVLYEQKTFACECLACMKGRGHEAWAHTEAEKASAVDGVVQLTDWDVSGRPITRILADYFGIDQAKIDAEKQAMFEALRSSQAGEGR